MPSSCSMYQDYLIDRRLMGTVCYSSLTKDKNVDYSFIGSLIPEDEEDFVFNDVHNLRYRKYKAVIDTMEITMLKEWSNPQFHVYPMLSDVEQLYLTEDKNEKVIEE